MKRLYTFALLLFLLAGCGGKSVEPSGPEGAEPSEMTVTSTDFRQGGTIPTQFTCQGGDFSPALQWSTPPEGTESLALIVDDPDAPGGTWVHWVVYNIPPDTTGLAQGASRAETTVFDLPQGAIQGTTSFKRSDYGGPCPPSGTHRYYFHMYALDITLNSPEMDKAGLLEAMQGHILAMGELMGIYTRE